MVTSTDRKVNRSKRIARKGSSPPLNIMKMTRKNIATISKIAGDSGQFRSISLNQFLDTDLLTTFMEYRIVKVTASYVLVNAPNNNAAFPTLFLAPQQYLTGSAPASRDEVVSFKGVKHYQFGPTAVRHDRSFDLFVPMDAASTGRAFVKSPWLSITSDTVPHYSSAEWITRYNSTSDATHTLELVITAVIELRGIR